MYRALFSIVPRHPLARESEPSSCHAISKPFLFAALGSVQISCGILVGLVSGQDVLNVTTMQTNQNTFAYFQCPVLFHQ